MPHAAVDRRAGDVRRDPAGAHGAKETAELTGAVQVLTQRIAELTTELVEGELTELRRLASAALRTTAIVQKGETP